MFLIPKLDAKGEDRTTCFQKKHCTGFIKPRLDYVFVSNSLQEFVNNTSILTSLSTDHSPVHLSLSKENKTGNLESSDNLRKYESLKSGLELIYDHIAAGVRIRSKCLWYEEGW